MNHSFLIRPAQLNQAFESNSSSGSGDLTRRSFIKRTGGATVATMIAWNTSLTAAFGAEPTGGQGSGSGSYWVEGTPAGTSPPNENSACWAPELSITGHGSFFAKAMMTTTPANGNDAGEVKIYAELHAWKSGDSSATTKGTLRIAGFQNNGVFWATTAPHDPLDDEDSLEIPLASWIDTGSEGELEERNRVVARLEVTSDVTKTIDRRIDCKVRVVQYMAEWLRQSNQTTPQVEEREVDVEEQSFSLYVVLKSSK